MSTLRNLSLLCALASLGCLGPGDPVELEIDETADAVNSPLGGGCDKHDQCAGELQCVDNIDPNSMVKTCQPAAARPAIETIRAGTECSDCNLEDIYFPGLVAVGLRAPRATLDGATLPGAKIKGSYLPEASLAGADLSHASLYNSNLRGANLISANLEETDFTGCDLHGATLDEGALGALCDAHSTGLPRGFRCTGGHIAAD